MANSFQNACYWCGLYMSTMIAESSNQKRLYINQEKLIMATKTILYVIYN